jgi:hypothetical protein
LCIFKLIFSFSSNGILPVAFHSKWLHQELDHEFLIEFAELAETAHERPLCQLYLFANRQFDYDFPMTILKLIKENEKMRSANSRR